MLDVMGFMDARSLGSLAFVSRALYVYAHVEELWKTLVVQVCYMLGNLFFLSDLMLQTWWSRQVVARSRGMLRVSFSVAVIF